MNFYSQCQCGNRKLVAKGSKRLELSTYFDWCIDGVPLEPVVWTEQDPIVYFDSCDLCMKGVQ
jgi:hypothetical protein